MCWIPQALQPLSDIDVPVSFHDHSEDDNFAEEPQETVAPGLQQHKTDQSLKLWQLPASISLKTNHQKSRYSSPGILL